MLSVYSAFLIFLASSTSGFLVPNPPGRQNVTLTTGTLIDYTRNGRELMLSVFQPATCESTVPAPYMPNKTAEYEGPWLQSYFNFTEDLTPIFLEARLPVCPDDDASGCSPLDEGPILLFSPGYLIPRLYYSVLASAIASEGFTVISIDHPEDANIITYPDGHTVLTNAPLDPSDDDFVRYVGPRVADASFIIDQLGNASAVAHLLPKRGPRPIPTDRIAMLGHSLGGVSAVVAAGQDPRIRGAINWDGTIFNKLPSSGISQPVLYVSEANTTDSTWVDAWPQLKGPKLWIEVANTTHQSFADMLGLLQVYGVDTTPFADLLGTIAPKKLARILAKYTAAWMNGVFTGKRGPLLRKQEPHRFPEVSIKRKSGY
ncbi:hypothetical protein EJ04DRAFT_493098 [Polyplosphaeria fusca]|uniref:1-alkyl-2-acetylglycerophosphocholine esterase n=1 Tax=Polyplosphaeria fusca TaxID=682080 RepID=A0A9P4QVV2_9PLEO|nr:hypothetical protein EJ04DRAFT_493098 [Polyplosphaeria fusca]